MIEAFAVAKKSGSDVEKKLEASIDAFLQEAIAQAEYHFRHFADPPQLWFALADAALGKEIANFVFNSGISSVFVHCLICTLLPVLSIQYLGIQYVIIP